MQSYQLTKTIRFKLEPLQRALAEEVDKLRQHGDSTEEIHSLCKCAKNLISALEEYLYETRDQDGEQKTALKSSLEIKTGFLKQHTRQYFYDWDSERRREKNHKIHRVCYLPEALEGWLGRWRELVERLEALLNRPPEDRPRRAELALVVAEFRKRENFHFIADFVGLSQDKKTDEWHKPLESQIPELKTSLAQCEQIYLPSQTSGVAIARASFNYYTINKRPKNYPKEIKNKRDELKQEMERDADSIAKQIGVQYTDSIREFVIERIFTQPDKTITLDSLYKELKIYKATEKSRFLEAISQDLKFSSIKDDHPLFECGEGDFDTFIQQTKEIKELSDQVAKLDKQSADYDRRSRQLREKITQQKQQRGKFFQRKAKKYGNFCDLFKRIAMKRGRILAAVKGLEREQIDSQLLNYWALIVEKQSSHYLMLIPKDQRKEAYEMLDSEHESPDAAVTIHYFKSLTMRALQKLCFGVDGNTFEPGIREELREQHPDKYGKVIDAFSLGQFESKTESEKETEIVRFYQAVLKTKYVKKTLDIEDFRELRALAENPEVKTRDEFQPELERICYVKRILADQGLERNLLDRCGARLLRISSYDLRKEVGDKGKDKRHTQLWRQFWSSENRDDHYPVRLNPEIKIYWRDARESRIKKYGQDSDQYDPDKHNRFLQSQFTLVTTMTENALGQRYDLAFARPDELARKIGEFNKHFNQTHARKPHEMYFYGIDRGNAELATLAIVSRFSEKKNQFNQPIPEFAQFKVWRLKQERLKYAEEYPGKGGNKKRRAIDNLSYFIDKDDLRDDLFGEVETSSIDLTTAKLIKGRIIENGDVLSYLRLKELSAKRRLYEYWSQSIIDNKKQSPIYFLEEKQAFCVHTLDDNPQAIIYYYRPDLESIQPRAVIRKMLQDYLQELNTKNRERDVLTIEKINHLRDALAANMVGVIAHLYKQFPGIIVLENLPESEIESHFVKSNENISRRLEWRLYNRFQNEGLVPPRIKESILLRKTKSINQFGLVLFVPTKYTSQECPRCGKRVTVTYKNEQPVDDEDLNKYPGKKLPTEEKEKIREDNKKLKEHFTQNKYSHDPKFHCPRCKFDTSTDGKEFSGINDPDKVASFNIAKRAYEHILNPPQDLKPEAKENRGTSKTGKKGKNRSKNNRPQSTKSSPPPKNKPFAGLDRLLKK